MSFIKPKIKAASKRDDKDGAVMVIPHYVMNSNAYQTLGGNAIRLFNDMAMQYNGKDNNGRLLASFNYMKKNRGWTSAGALHNALKILLERKLLWKSVQGHRPNKASWYAICWAALDETKIDFKVNDFPRGAYAHWIPSIESKLARKMPPPKKLGKPKNQRQI